MEPRKRGRPPGKTYVGTVTVRLTAEDMGALRRLAEAWECSLSGAFRKLLEERHDPEGDAG